MTDIDALQKAAREIRGDMSFLNASNNAETWLRHIKTSMDSTAKAILVKFRATNLRNSFTGLILSGVDGAGLPWTVQYPVRS